PTLFSSKGLGVPYFEGPAKSLPRVDEVFFEVMYETDFEAAGSSKEFIEEVVRKMFLKLNDKA
ncbi:MAG: hypothetical protein V7723_12910, partial [Sneathiella sp.]|uniref:hypothetical protein n=1 Tax=Sneathiella sp. TaxID=1964365 RepID=UPI003001C41B